MASSCSSDKFLSGLPYSTLFSRVWARARQTRPPRSKLFSSLRDPRGGDFLEFQIRFRRASLRAVFVRLMRKACSRGRAHSLSHPFQGNCEHIVSIPAATEVIDLN